MTKLLKTQWIPFSVKTVKISVLMLPPFFIGCASTEVHQVESMALDETICVVKNPAVKEDFLRAYSEVLETYGLSVRLVQPDEKCALKSTYEARYGFHWGFYLAIANLYVYSDDKELGSVKYRAPRADPSKHGRVKNKISILVAKLFGFDPILEEAVCEVNCEEG